jgi:MYXO-CTERM domain-containing protein
MVLALSLVPAGAAAAKKPVSAKVCGPSDCHTVKDRDSLMALSEGGPPTDPPDRGAPWYSVRMTIEIDHGRRDSFSTAMVPSAGLMRGADASEGYVWMPATARGARVYRRVTRGLAPFPPASLKGVGPPRVRVDEVVLPAERPRQDGGSSPLPWIAGGVALLALAGLLLRRRGLPWPKPAQG